MKKSISVLVIAVVLFTSCNNSNQSKNNEVVVADSIKFYEETLFGSSAKEISSTDALKLANYYVQYASQNQDDSLSPIYLFKSADIFMNIREPEKAINAHKIILQKYPDFEKASSAMFLTAFIYEDQLMDLANAEKYYKLFIEEYPDSDFADDAEISLNNLGKTPEQLIEEFEKMNK